MTSAIATGLATIHADGIVLDAWFPTPQLTDTAATGTEEITAPQEFSALWLPYEKNWHIRMFPNH